MIVTLQTQILELKRIEHMTKSKVTVPTIARDQGLTATTLTTTEGPNLNPMQEKDPDISQMITKTQVMKIQPLPEKTKEVTKRILILTLRTIWLFRKENVANH